MSRHSRALSGSQSIYRRDVCCPWCAGSSHDGVLETSEDTFGHSNINLLSTMKEITRDEDGFAQLKFCGREDAICGNRVTEFLIKHMTHGADFRCNMPDSSTPR